MGPIGYPYPTPNSYMTPRSQDYRRHAPLFGNLSTEREACFFEWIEMPILGWNEGLDSNGNRIESKSSGRADIFVSE